MSLGEKHSSPPKQNPPHSFMNGPYRRPENVPPRFQRGPPPGHRPSFSEEERRRQQLLAQQAGLDIFADPPANKDRSQDRERRPRRNSESSVFNKSTTLDEEEEKKRRERKYRESKRPGTSRSKPVSKKLDVIDKLDVTSIYGTGCKTNFARVGDHLLTTTVFHHDGPFDACHPARNRRRHKLAPMQAFPKDSENMKIGGSGPLNDKLDYNKYHGFGQEAHIDFNEARQEQAVVDDDAAYFNNRPIPADRSQSFNATARVDPVHGQETAGLGTSTFLEGAPASRAAIQRRDSEFEQQLQAQPVSLSRKKSLVQKIRGVRPGGSGRVQSPDQERPPQSPSLNTSRSENGANPFFKDYDAEYDRKGAQIAFAEDQARPTRTRAPSSPRRGMLERTITAGSADTSQAENKPIGLLGRMKSLKKTKPKHDRREPS